MAEGVEEAKSAPTWTVEINDATLLEGFAGELEKTLPAKESFLEDYNSICETHGVCPCPYIIPSGGSIMRIANTKVDLPSWRAGLMALSTIGSKIEELALHNCELSFQHIEDLILAVEKRGSLPVVKLDYITIVQAPVGEGEELPDRNSIYLKLFGDFNVEYLSLKGNNFGDEFCGSESFYKALSENVFVKALNFADNKIGDQGAKNILNACRIAASINEISLVQNSGVEGECLDTLVALLLGAEVSAEDNATFKNFAKLIGDKNKAIKDSNKKRKKAGLADLVELGVPAERIEKVNEVNMIANRLMKSIDLSFCPISSANFASFVGSMKNEGRVNIAAPELNMNVVIRGNKATTGSVSLEEPIAGITFVE